VCKAKESVRAKSMYFRCPVGTMKKTRSKRGTSERSGRFNKRDLQSGNGRGLNAKDRNMSEREGEPRREFNYCT